MCMLLALVMFVAWPSLAEKPTEFLEDPSQTLSRSEFASMGFCEQVEDPVPEDDCWNEYQRIGRTYFGDVNDDGIDEVLIFPGEGFHGSGGVQFFVLERTVSGWKSLLPDGWQVQRGRTDILPIRRGGFRDIRLSVSTCFKWDGTEYVPYETDDYYQLPRHYFDEKDYSEAEIFWSISNEGKQEFHVEPQWFPLPDDWPHSSTNGRLMDNEYDVTWVALFKGGVWGVEGRRGFLLVPRPSYLGAGRLQLDGDFLLLLESESDDDAPSTVLGKFNRKTGMFTWVEEESVWVR